MNSDSLAVEHRERDRLVVLREELGCDRAEGRHDRQVGRARAEPQRADPEREAAVGVAHDPAALDEDRADPVQRALCEPELAGELGEAEMRLRCEEIEHRQRCMDARGRSLSAGRDRVRLDGELLAWHDRSLDVSRTTFHIENGPS